MEFVLTVTVLIQKNLKMATMKDFLKKLKGWKRSQRKL